MENSKVIVKSMFDFCLIYYFVLKCCAVGVCDQKNITARYIYFICFDMNCLFVCGFNDGSICLYQLCLFRHWMTCNLMSLSLQTSCVTLFNGFGYSLKL